MALCSHQGLYFRQIRSDFTLWRGSLKPYGIRMNLSLVAQCIQSINLIFEYVVNLKINELCTHERMKKRIEILNIFQARVDVSR